MMRSIVFRSATSIATSRPSCVVIGITTDISVARYCLAYRGLHPFLYTGEIKRAVF